MQCHRHYPTIYRIDDVLLAFVPLQRGGNEMSPSPNVRHQSISMQLSTEFNNYFRNSKCKVLAEIDVSLEGEEDIDSVKEWVRPDISIICNDEKIKENYIAGAPDLIVEILSKSTAKRDKMIKFNRYQHSGVKEYWIVDPIYETVDICVLKNDYFNHLGTYANGGKVELSISQGLSIDLSLIF
jgi:Uma2 family endonuclease